MIRTSPLLQQAVNHIALIGGFSRKDWVVIRGDQLLQQVVVDHVALTGNFSRENWEQMVKNSLPSDSNAAKDFQKNNRMTFFGGSDSIAGSEDKGVSISVNELKRIT